MITISQGARIIRRRTGWGQDFTRLCGESVPQRCHIERRV